MPKPQLKKTVWEFAKWLISLVIGAIVLEILHVFHLYPEKWVAEYIASFFSAAPSVMQQQFIFLSLAATIATALLFAEHWLPHAVSRIVKRFTNKPPERYLSHLDSEMTHAIEGMAFRSAWGRWYSSQFLAKDKNYLVQDKHNQDHLMMIATSVVTDAAVNGKLEIRGRPRNSRKYETIPREDWRLIFLHPEPDIRTIWQVAIRPRSDVSTERIAELLEYDSLIVDSEKFEKLWPRNEAATDALRLKNLQAAKENGNAQSEIDKLM